MTDLDVKDAVRERDGYRCIECRMTNDQHYARRGRALEVHRLAPGSPYSVAGCVTLCWLCHAKKKQGRGIVTKQVRLPTDLLDLADSIAPMLGKTTAEYLAEIIWPALRRDAPKAGERLIKAAKPKNGD